MTSTLAPSTVGFFPTLPTTDDIPEEVDETVAPVSTTLSTSTTTTVSPRLGLFKTAGRKRFNFRPRLQVQREENNEVGEAEKEKPRFRAVKVPRRNRFRPKESAIRRASTTTTTTTTAAPTTIAAATTVEFIAQTTLRPEFTFFGSDSSPTPSTVLRTQPEVFQEAPRRLPAQQEVPRSSGADNLRKLVPLSEPAPAVFQPNSLFNSFVPVRQPSVFTQNINLGTPSAPQPAIRVQPQPARVAPQPQPARVAPRPQPSVRVAPQPQPARVAPQPPVRAQPQPVLRVQPQPVRKQPPAVRQSPAQPAAAPVRQNSLFPVFELPDFFRIPFVAFRSSEPSSSAQQSSAAPQSSGGALFNSIGQPYQLRSNTKN